MRFLTTKNIELSQSIYLLLFSFLLLSPVSSKAQDVTVSWSPNSEPDLAGYRVYVGNASGVYDLLSDTELVTQKVFSNLAEGNDYYFAVTAYDATGNESFPSDEVSIHINDMTPPTRPENLEVSASSLPQINLSWNPSADNVGVAGYTIYRNGAAIIKTDAIDYTDTGLLPNTQYTYQVAAFDAAGNQSADSLPAEVSTSATLFTLSVSVIGSGTVYSTPAGISCSNDSCSAGFQPGKVVKLTTASHKKWTFSHWEGGCTGSDECFVEMVESQSVIANFVQRNKGTNGKGRKGKSG